MDQGRQVRGEVDLAVVPELQGQPGALQLFALAYNLGNLLRRSVLPRAVKHWSLTTLRELFAVILERFQRFAAPPPLVRRGSGRKAGDAVKRKASAARVRSWTADRAWRQSAASSCESQNARR